MNMNMNMMQSATFRDYALFFLRLVIVSVFLYHGFPKSIDWAMASEKFMGFGLPGFLGPITGIAEVIASLLILVGIQNRWANLALLFIIAGAIATVQLPKAIEVAEYTAGLERDMMILVGTLISAAFGPGALTLSKPMDMPNDPTTQI